MAKEKTKSEDKGKMTFEEFGNAINKALKKEIVYSPGKSRGVFDRPRSSSGVLSLDIALYGGYPTGCNYLVYGNESSGKSYLMMKRMAEITNREDNDLNKVFLEDPENSFDVVWAEKIGINLSNIQVSRCEYAEQSMDLVVGAIASGLFAGVFLDSLAALSPKVEVDGGMEDKTMGGNAYLIGKMYRKIETSKAEAFRLNKKFFPDFYAINQFREKIGVMFGDPRTLPGGKAQHFFSHVKLEIKVVEKIIVNDISMGTLHEIFVAKNKTAPPYSKATFKLINNGANAGTVDNILILFNMLVDSGVIQKSGSWYNQGDTKLGQGAEKASDFLRKMSGEELNGLLDLSMEGNDSIDKVEFRF